jgi:hypothetical protein
VVDVELAMLIDAASKAPDTAVSPDATQFIPLVNPKLELRVQVALLLPVPESEQLPLIQSMFSRETMSPEIKALKVSVHS